ncbi:MAG: sporulation protein SpoVT [Betaproteobacteria bacterium RIFCSPHIGHO2_12_FULL_69_13]|nr:MAG: sporulation protein SpoVT [Betaproteobacteria bacterium RIFCSPHIGHO2_12_FULL_69_13]OGA68964.1 MAG: sporulation protein SpoVT [Betaproteobacteria bacterium RIFCSPLOWO2_12_FULL_68_20]
MDVVKLGKKGQVSLPAAVLRKLGLEGRATLLVEATEDGAVILRPAGVYPIELYSAARVKEFEQSNRLAPADAKRVQKALRRRRR